MWHGYVLIGTRGLGRCNIVTGFNHIPIVIETVLEWYALDSIITVDGQALSLLVEWEVISAGIYINTILRKHLLPLRLTKLLLLRCRDERTTEYLMHGRSLKIVHLQDSVYEPTSLLRNCGRHPIIGCTDGRIQFMLRTTLKRYISMQQLIQDDTHRPDVHLWAVFLAEDHLRWHEFSCTGHDLQLLSLGRTYSPTEVTYLYSSILMD